MKPRIKLDEKWLEQARAFAEQSVSGYRSGQKESSRQYARPGIDKSVDAQLLGRAGECAFCCFLNLDPATSLDWSANLDSGWDMVVRGRRIDVKSSGTEYLMWPVTKNGFLQQCEAHLFVLVSRLEEDLFEIGGWITVANFIANHHTARPPAFMDEGTKYLHKSELMELQRSNARRAPQRIRRVRRRRHLRSLLPLRQGGVVRQQRRPTPG